MKKSRGILLAALCLLSGGRARAQEAGAAPDAVRSEDTSDDPVAQDEVDRSAAELEAVRKAEEKAGLVPQAPGAGPHDGLSVGLDPADPLLLDLEAARGTGIDGSPRGDPQPAVGVSARLPELLGISEQELRAKYDIPVELNDAVVAYIRFFQTDAREHFTKWLARSGRYLPMMRQVLEKQGLPLDLVYLSMIESGFSSYAYSFAKAAGLWQFVLGTSRRYGLVTDFWVDERRDPVKSTLAAARYLRDLKDRFHGDWYLAWAGYNAGEGRVVRAIRRERTRDFWRMMGHGRTLRAETRHYVPKLIAAALIAKHPERFGFHIDYEKPPEVEEVFVPDATDLHVAAQAAGITFEQLHDLNPDLRRFCTPPGGFHLRLPKGSRDTFVANYQKLDARDRLSFVEHRLEKGEPIGRVARAYGVSEGAILRTNGLKSYRQLKPGRILVIPIVGSSRLLAGTQIEGTQRRLARTVVAAATARAAPARPTAAAAPSNKDGTALYTVRPGDSLSRIAARFSTTVGKLMRLNNLTGKRARSLQIGQTLAVRDS